MNHERCPIGGYKRQWHATLVIAVALYAAWSTNAAAEGPLPLVLDMTDEEPPFRAALSSALALELHRPIVAAIEIEPAPVETLTIIIKGTQAKLLHTRFLETKERATALPHGQDEKVRRLVWLAGNLCRDQVTELAPPDQKKDGEPSTTVVEAPEPPTASVTLAVTEPGPPSLHATAIADDMNTPQEWLVRLSAGPAVNPYSVYNSYRSAGNEPWISRLYAGTTIQVDVEYRPMPSGNWMASVIRGGSDLFLAGGAVSRVWGWQRGRNEVKLFGGAGISVALIANETIETSSSSRNGTESRRVVTLQRGADAFATAGAVWTFALSPGFKPILRLSAIVPNSDYQRGALLSLTVGFDFGL